MHNHYDVTRLCFQPSSVLDHLLPSYFEDIINGWPLSKFERKPVIASHIRFLILALNLCELVLTLICLCHHKTSVVYSGGGTVGYK